MKLTFNTVDDLVEWVYTMHLQNTNGRETENEMFRLGIENCIEELTDLKLLDPSDIGTIKVEEFCECEDTYRKIEECTYLICKECNKPL